MKPLQSDIALSDISVCEVCQKTIEPDEAYAHDSTILYEDCCIEARIPRVRKTHWQYLGSIKADYLIPGRKA